MSYSARQLEKFQWIKSDETYSEWKESGILTRGSLYGTIYWVDLGDGIRRPFDMMEFDEPWVHKKLVEGIKANWMP